MATVRHHTRIDATPDEVWALVSDPSAVDRIFPGVDVEVDGDVRAVDMGGMVVKEAIVTSRDDLRRFQYAIVEAPMDVESHLATIDVIDDGEGCLLVYSVDVKPDELGPLFDGTMADATRSIKRHVEG
jgi:ligand-binding SRPBCC domain-containing protein